MKKERITAIFLALALLLTACGEQTEQGGEETAAPLRAYVCAPLETLDPAMHVDAGAQSLLSAVFEGLMRVRSDGKGGSTVVEGMAKEYEVEKSYDDTVTYTFRLRSSARWSDGEKVTAHDFVYAWRRLADPATESPNASLLRMVAGYDEVRETGDVTALGVKAEDESTFVVTLSSPCSYFLDTVCTLPAAAPLREELVTGSETWATDARVVVNGPFTVTSWAKDKSLFVEKNPEYYESRIVSLQKIEFLFAASPEEAYERYQNGEIDYLGSLGAAALSQLASEEGAALQPLAVTVCALYNNATDTFSSARLRKAFDMALDRAALAEAAGAAAETAVGLVPYGITDYVSETGDFRTCGGDMYLSYEDDAAARAEAARRELAAAGNYNGAGVPMLACIYVEGELSAAFVSKLLAMWRETLNVSITATAYSREEYEKKLGDEEFDIALHTLRGSYDDPMNFLARWGSEHPDNVIAYSNNTYDLLIGVADAATDVTARTAFLHDAEAMVLEDCALSPLFFQKTATCVNGWTGIFADSFGRSYFLSAQPAEGAEK